MQSLVRNEEKECIEICKGVSFFLSRLWSVFFKNVLHSQFFTTHFTFLYHCPFHPWHFGMNIVYLSFFFSSNHTFSIRKNIYWSMLLNVCTYFHPSPHTYPLGWGRWGRIVGERERKIGNKRRKNTKSSLTCNIVPGWIHKNWVDWLSLYSMSSFLLCTHNSTPFSSCYPPLPIQFWKSWCKNTLKIFFLKKKITTWGKSLNIYVYISYSNEYNKSKVEVF